MGFPSGSAVLLVVVVLAGCTTTKVEPALDWPEKPALHWTCDLQACSLPLADANALERWFIKLQYFKEARDRVLGR
jgi:hypothetical protein